MKKVLTLLICAMLSVFILAGCSEASPVSISTFDEMAQSADYIVSHDESTVASYPSVLNDVSIAIKTKEDQTELMYQIEFWDFKTGADAQNFYNTNKNNFETVKSDSNTTVSFSAGSTSSYQLTSNETYYVVIQVENTGLYVVAPSDYKDEISTFLKSIGYIK